MSPEPTEDPEVPRDALSFSFVRAGGPGGQHVNKVATAVQLRVALGRTLLSEAVKARLRKLAGSQATHRDEVVIFAHRFRSQRRNKEDALARWQDLLASARATPKRRLATRPTQAQRQARLDDKRQHGRIKKLRRKTALLD